MNYLQITNDSGALLIANPSEPPVDSVVLTSGLNGTAWQRLRKDGLWHSTAYSSPVEWGNILKCDRVFVIHEAPQRETKGAQR